MFWSVDLCQGSHRYQLQLPSTNESNSGFSFLPKDTLTSEQEEP